MCYLLVLCYSDFLSLPFLQRPAGQRLRVRLPRQVADVVAAEHQRHSDGRGVRRAGGHEGQASQ